jgi:enamine deaminase RidA (YjgF/YER057c/UK114 family)
MSDATKLVATYIKMRDAKEAMTDRHKEELKGLTDQMELVEQALLELCKSTGQDGGKTTFGTFTRVVKTRYWTSDWPSMYKLIKEHDAFDLLEQRVSQGNFKAFLKSNPDLMPPGMNVESKYAVTVRRAQN